MTSTDIPWRNVSYSLTEQSGQYVIFSLLLVCCVTIRHLLADWILSHSLYCFHLLYLNYVVLLVFTGCNMIKWNDFLVDRQKTTNIQIIRLWVFPIMIASYPPST